MGRKVKTTEKLNSLRVESIRFGPMLWSMAIVEENRKVLASLFHPDWRQMALRSGAVERLRGFRSPDALLRTLLLHVGRGYSLRETTVRAKLANWADVSDVALLKRLRNSDDMPAWEMIPAPCSRNCASSNWSKSYCRRELEWRSESVSSVVPRSTKRSCFNDSDCSYRRAWK
jgi:hypothetical protein